MDKTKFYKLILDNRIADHIIYNYINDNNIKYTKNNNGIFFNLNSLDDNQEKELYKLINDYIKNIDMHDKKLCDIKKIVDTPIIKEIKEIAYEKINLDDFTIYEKKIIYLSKFF